MTTYFTSDLHFYHKNICKFTDRHKVVQQEQHEEWLIDIWNNTCTKSDKVWHLGDFTFLSRYEEIAALVKKLPGQKFFIKGNHDRTKVLDALKKDGLIQNWYHYEEIKIGETPACLFHFPIASWHKVGYGAWHLHGHCVDMSTELLTANGWKKFGEFTENDLVPAYNFTKQKTEMSPILEIFKPTYSGEVFTLQGKSANLRMTKDHRIVGETAHNAKPVEFTPITVPSSRVNLVHSLNCDIEDMPISDELLKLYVYCTADGSLKKETGLWRIRVKKIHKKEELNRVLTVLNKDFKVYEKDGYSSFNFYAPELEYLAPKGLDNKLRQLSSRQFVILLEAYSLSDGSKNGKGFLISTAKKTEVDLLQELAVTRGWSCSVLGRIHGFSKNIQYQLSIYPKSKITCSSLKSMKSEEVQNEQFWCIKTTTGNFMVRREGKVHLTGNCHGSYKVEQGKILDVGIDSAYNLYGEHKFFSEEDIIEYMSNRQIKTVDHHRIVEKD